MSKFKCKCGQKSFTDSSVPIENCLVSYSHSNHLHLLRKGLYTENPRTAIHEIIGESTKIQHQGRLIFVCPVCGRIHIFWNDILCVTYSPEAEYHFQQGTDESITIGIPYQNQAITDAIAVNDE